MSRAEHLLITGATGTLGRAFNRAACDRGLSHVLTSRTDLDAANPASIEAALALWRPWAVVNATGFVRVDEAESQQDLCRRANLDANVWLARACAKADIPLVTFSTDLVFSGDKGAPYVESDSVHPLNCYGRCKAASEVRVLEIQPRALVVRTSAFFGRDTHNFVLQVRERLANGERVLAADDQVVSPTYVPDLVNAVLDLLIDGENGVWHVANAGAISWHELALEVVVRIGADPRLVTAATSSELGLKAARPPYSALTSERGWIMPSLEDALSRCLADLSEWTDS